jgi:hypothetical protein
MVGGSRRKERKCHGKDTARRGLSRRLNRSKEGPKGWKCAGSSGSAKLLCIVGKKGYAGMGVSELRRLKKLEEENRRLKGLVADLTLDKHILQEVLRKKP